MSLRLRIAPNSSTPIYRQIVDQVALALSLGNLRAGDPLPSVRALAEQLLVNPNTIAKAYAELVREGHAEAHPGRGLFAATRREVLSAAEQHRRLEDSLDRFLNQAILLGLSRSEIHKVVTERLDALAAKAATRDKHERRTDRG